MDIETIILALEDAKSRGIKSASVILNSNIENFCQVKLSEITVSDVTGCVFYIDGHSRGFLGWTKPKKSTKD